MRPALRLLSTAAEKQFLKSGAKRDPELYVMGAIMVAAFAGAGYYFGQNPTSSGRSKHLDETLGRRNWGQWKHQEHEAPSALHEVVIPNVNLPKELHEKFNKYGKEDY